MRIDRLQIQRVRNLLEIDVRPGVGVNFFHGSNGAGKTALLESVHVLARGRSFRGTNASELMTRGEKDLLVRAELCDEQRGRVKVAMSRQRSGSVDLRINGLAEKRLSRAAELMPLQLMLPSLSDLVFGAPAVRRQWLDWGMFHVEPGYLATLRRYLRALRQRNAALKAVAADTLGLPGAHAWTDELAQAGEAVSEMRDAYLQQLGQPLNDVLSRLTPDLRISLGYQRGWPENQPLIKVLGESASREVKLGSTQFGPHRAEVQLRHEGSRAGVTLSRGQGKILASALMLAQAVLLKLRQNRSSVFLIDDLGAELDAAHARRLFQELVTLNSQVLATSTEAPGDLRGLADLPMTRFHVEHGQIRAEPPQ
ncbi:MAG: DNA replication/repair protein RecF [Pseudomonadales bacterium]